MTVPVDDVGHAEGSSVTDGHALGLDHRRYYRIEHYDQMPPFLMTLVGASNLWLFLSSTGGVSAGRQDAESAIFPYYTEDKVAESTGHTGGLTQLRVRRADGPVAFWHPFAPLRPGDPVVERNLFKDFLGTTVVFEETRADLGLCLRVAWQTSARYGVVRRCELTSLADATLDVDVLDGERNLLPAGASQLTQNQLSVLLDAYKRSELDPATGLGIFYLNSALTDLAEASESLAANVAWQVGLEPRVHLLSVRQLAGFGRGLGLEPEHEVRGERGAYLVRAELRLAPGERRSWRGVMDVDLSAADVVALRAELTEPGVLAARLDEDVERTRRELETLIGAADATQVTGDELATAHHGANVLFNVMRGGVPLDGYRTSAADVRAFVATRSPLTAVRCAEVLEGMPSLLTTVELVATARASGDPDLERLAAEYLPLTFSRRHGDPSRPWNAFRIALHGPDGSPRLDFQGNWRDIFQNWEALAWSFPELTESMVAVFVDATTADGYNPYRVSRAGIDWEVPEPENPWANIGYWSDHQIVYLVKLLETSERFHPGRLGAVLDRPVCTHADVPYRIAGYEQTLADPYATISFDHAAAERIARRVEVEGADGKLVHGPDGELLRVPLAEKLLVLLLAKLVNLVPEGGIWMNTQRPEWNDANNALVGRGLSVVTLAYLRRYLVALRGLLDRDVTLTSEVAGLLAGVTAVLDEHAAGTVEGFDDAARRRVVDGLGAAGTTYRERVYAGFDGGRVDVARQDVHALLDLATAYVESGLRANRRDDGLYHSYNLLVLGPDLLSVRHLHVMLEGQVAVASSGALSPARTVELLAALRASDLYRADQHSYQLYPDRELPGFLDKNVLADGAQERCPLVAELVVAHDTSVVLRDVEGRYRFAPGIHHARDVVAALRRAAGTVVPAASVERDGDTLLDLFEETFRHSEFTGRSGSFFAYEGLGSIYWHMVSKLLLAVQETLERAVSEGADDDVVEALRASYEDVRRGLGYCKSPEVYGAFPVDPYSHTPAGRGARQPGMTGQVKEEVLTRLGELGLRVEHGRIVLRPVLLRESEWTGSPSTLSYVDVRGEPRSIALPAGRVAFTFCQVPVVCSAGDRTEVAAELADGSVVAGEGGALDAATSAEVFARTGRVRALTVTVGPRAGGAVRPAP